MAGLSATSVPTTPIASWPGRANTAITALTNPADACSLATMPIRDIIRYALPVACFCAYACGMPVPGAAPRRPIRKTTRRAVSLSDHRCQPVPLCRYNIASLCQSGQVPTQRDRADGSLGSVPPARVVVPYTSCKSGTGPRVKAAATLKLGLPAPVRLPERTPEGMTTLLQRPARLISRL